jgi:hypothetical protein
VTMTLILLFGCVALSALALWRGWSPALDVSLGIGLVVRLVMVYLSHTVTPHDVAVYFYEAGQDVVHGQDPLTSMPRYQWNFLPFSAYLLAAAAKTGLSWQYASKLLPVACDLATIAGVGRLVRAEGHRRNAQLLYALSPVALLVSAWHGQLEPITISLGLSALLLARRQQALAAGVVLGFAVASKSWPLVFLPGVFRYIPWRRWWDVAAGVLVVLTGWALVIPLALHDSLRNAVEVLVGYRSYSGVWGWTGLLRYANLTGYGYSGPGVDTAQRVGTIVTVVAIVMVLAIFWLRLHRSPEDITVAIILAVLIASAGGGPQYLLWPAALLYALRRPAGYVYLLLASAWTGLFYLQAYPTGETTWGWPGAVLEALSIAILLAALASMPWKTASNGDSQGLASANPRIPAGHS